MDKRHLRRIKIVQELFSSEYSNEASKNDLSDRTKEILKHLDEFTHHIELYAQKYAIDKIAKVDLSILRQAIFELLIEKTVPPKVIINEAVELAKELGGEKSPGFINAVLGKIYEKSLQDAQQID